MKIRVLAARDIHDLLSYGECTSLIRETLADLSRGLFHQPLRTVSKPPGAPGLLVLMPAYAARAGYGVKALCVTPGNAELGKDSHQGAMLLFEAQTGEPAALLNASALTEIRTASASAVATGLLARPDAARLAIIGAGVQARAHAYAIAASRPLTGIHIVARDFGHSRDLAADLAERLGLPVRVFAAVPDALAKADIVVTATTAHEPVLRREWLAPGTHVNAVGACVPADREIDTATMVTAAIFADSRESVYSESGDYLLAQRDAPGAVRPVRAELGEIITGVAQGRADDDEITVFESLGLAAEDLAVASYTYAKAEHLGAGTQVGF